MAPSKRIALGELSTNVPSVKRQFDENAEDEIPEPPAKKIKSTPQTSLLVSSAKPEAIQQFVDMIHGRLPEPPAKNKSLTPRIRQLTDQHLAFPQPVPYGHCMYLVQRTNEKSRGVVESVKLIEGGTNNDSPR